MTRRKKRSLVRGDRVYVLGPPPPRRKPVIDRSMPSTWEQYVDKKDSERDLQQRAEETETTESVSAAIALLDAAFGGASVRDALGETDGGDEADETDTDGGEGAADQEDGAS